MFLKILIDAWEMVLLKVLDEYSSIVQIFCVEIQDRFWYCIFLE